MSKAPSKRARAQKRGAVCAVENHPQCAQCRPAKCCQYFSLQIDTPRSKRDYDDLLWMLAHRHVSVYIEETVWYLMVHTECTFLDKRTNRCTIYESRPQMCREHSVDDCEWHGDYEFEEHFKSYEELERWLCTNGPNKK